MFWTEEVILETEGGCYKWIEGTRNVSITTNYKRYSVENYSVDQDYDSVEHCSVEYCSVEHCLVGHDNK